MAGSTDDDDIETVTDDDDRETVTVARQDWREVERKENCGAAESLNTLFAASMNYLRDQRAN